MTTSRPTADPDAWTWGWGGAYESVQVGEGRTRGQARARFADECCEPITAVSVWKRYGRRTNRQEQWEDHIADRDDMGPDLPDEVPDDWEPYVMDESIGYWAICAPDAEGAVRIWICALRGERRPPTPEEGTS